MDGALANMGITATPWRPFFSVASVIALTNSVVAGARCGVARWRLSRRALSLSLQGLAVVAFALTAHYRLGFRRFVGALERFSPNFPTDHVIEPSSGGCVTPQ